jgi:tetratricopeptide (TPR) repeat protein
MVDLQGAKVDIRVLTSIGNCFRKLKQFDKGIPYFEQALEREADNFYALFGIADCYRGVGKQDNSLTYWNKILEKDPRNKVILTRAGDAYRSLGEIEKATKYYEDALNIEFDVYAILGLAMIARNQGKWDDAITSLKMLIQNDPKNYRIYLELAQCYVAAGQRQQAAEVLADFQKTGIKNPFIQDALARLSPKAN